MRSCRITKEHQDNNGKTEDICPVVIPFGADLLRRAVDFGPNTGAKKLTIFIGKVRKILGILTYRLQHSRPFRQSIVDYFTLSIPIEYNIVEFYISMNYLLGMQVL